MLQDWLVQKQRARPWVAQERVHGVILVHAMVVEHFLEAPSWGWSPRAMNARPQRHLLWARPTHRHWRETIWVRTGAEAAVAAAAARLGIMGGASAAEPGDHKTDR